MNDTAYINSTSVPCPASVITSIDPSSTEKSCGTLQVWLKIPVTTAMIDPQFCHTSTRATDESFIVTQFIVETDVIHKKISSWDGDITEGRLVD